jgi:hypothetical protein
VTDEEFAEAVTASAATQLEQNKQRYAGLIDATVRRDGVDVVFEFEARKRPGTRYAYRASTLPDSPDERRDPDGLAGTLFAGWMEIVEADDVALPQPSGSSVTWVTD